MTRVSPVSPTNSDIILYMYQRSKIKPWKILNSKIIHSTPWIKIIEDTCSTNDKEFKYTYTRRVDEGPLIIAEEEDNSLWLVKQYRHPIKKTVWQFPIEGKQKYETWDDAAIRGLEEELQLRAEQWENLGEFYPDPGGLDQKYQIYLAKSLSKITSNNINHLENEIEKLEIKNFTRTQIEEMISNREICDNWTLSALFLYDRSKK